MDRLRRLFIACGLTALVLFAPAPSISAEPGQVQVQNVEVRVTAVGPVVLLKVRNRAIPIFVDAVVAESIHGALSGKKPKRPLTHDLMRAVLEGFDGKVTQVVVTLKDRIFYAALTVAVGRTTKIFDSRSSDAIALAIHFKAPILVNRELLDSSGMELEKPDGTLL
jgi:bifunctional DNase/RNase